MLASTNYDIHEDFDSVRECDAIISTPDCRNSMPAMSSVSRRSILGSLINSTVKPLKERLLNGTPRGSDSSTPTAMLHPCPGTLAASDGLSVVPPPLPQHLGRPYAGASQRMPVGHNATKTIEDAEESAGSTSSSTDDFYEQHYSSCETPQPVLAAPMHIDVGPMDVPDASLLLDELEKQFLPSAVGGTEWEVPELLLPYTE